MIDTSETLIRRLCDDPDNATWEQFFRIYWQTIMRYGQKLGLSAAEAEDVLQETMVDLMRILPNFEYDPQRKFRNFLLTIVHRKCLRNFRKSKSENRLMNRIHADPVVHTEISPSDGSDPSSSEQLWDCSLLESALFEMFQGNEIEEQTYHIYTEYVLRNIPAEDVAKKHGTSVNTIYQIKHRINQRLRDHFQERIADPMDPLFNSR